MAFIGTFIYDMRISVVTMKLYCLWKIASNRLLIENEGVNLKKKVSDVLKKSFIACVLIKKVLY